MKLSEQNKNRKKGERSYNLSTMVYGKVPPQAIDMEVAILGAIMLEKGALSEVSDILKQESFYKPGHQSIFRAMIQLDIKNSVIDILTVVEELKSMNELEAVGGAYYVTTLTNNVVSAANISAHARIVAQKFIQRELIKTGGELIQDCYENSADAFELLDSAEKKLSEIMNGNHRGRYSSLDAALVKSVQRIEHLRTLDSHLTGVASGFEKLDRVTHGWQNTDLIILAARPAVGKTAFALNLARNAIRKKIPTVFFSLEMSTGQLTQRLISAESGIWLDTIATGQLDDIQMRQLYSTGIQALSGAPLFIDDTAALNIFELRAKCRRLKNKHNIGLIIIDYLQLMSGMSERGGNREQEISQISRNLKQLAKELNLPIIALSQLSRAVENRTSEKKMPQLSDLRESGAIEQDADMVMFLYRPEYYDITANEMGESNKGETHVRIAKHRNGSLETMKLRALLHIQRFEEIEQEIPVAMPAPQGWRPINLPYSDKDE